MVQKFVKLVWWVQKSTKVEKIYEKGMFWVLNKSSSWNVCLFCKFFWTHKLIDFATCCDHAHLKECVRGIAREHPKLVRLLFIICQNVIHYWLWSWCICCCRLMSQLADVNIQSSIGMFTFYDILSSSCCTTSVRLFVHLIVDKICDLWCISHHRQRCQRYEKWPDLPEPKETVQVFL